MNNFSGIKVALNSLTDKIQKNVMVGATRASAREVQKEAKHLVRIRTGNLKLSVVVRKLKVQKDGVVRFTVITTNKEPNDGYYGRFLEFGTAKMSARPFLRPAYENKKEEVVTAFEEYAIKRIDKEIEKARR